MFDPRLYGWLGLAIAIACVFEAIPSKETRIWITSDILWPVNLVMDLFFDGYSLSGWHFSIAPCWVPDVVLIGICYLFVRNPLMATLLAGAAQFAVLMAGFALCWRALKLSNLKLIETLSLGTAIAITLWIAFHTDRLDPAYHRLLTPQTHVGNLIMQVYALWLALLLIRPAGRRTRSAAVGYALVCFAAGLSNLMFVVHTLVPLALGLALLAAARALPLRRAVLLILLGWSSAAAGALSNRVVFRAMAITGQSQVGWQPWRTAMETFSSGFIEQLGAFDLQHVLGCGWLVASIWISAVMFRRLRAASEPERESGAPLAFFFVAVAGAAILGPTALILGGSNGLTVFKNYAWTMHYLHPNFLLPLLAWPMLIGLLPPVRAPRWARRAATAAAGAAAVIGPAACLARTPAPAVPISRYVPEFVRVLDREAAKYGLRCGIAGYWQARLITLFSSTGLRAYAVDGSLKPLNWVSNAEWFSKSFEDHAKPPCFSFVVLDDPQWKITRATAVARSGEPSHEFQADYARVLVYTSRGPGTETPRCALSY